MQRTLRFLLALWVSLALSPAFADDYRPPVAEPGANNDITSNGSSIFYAKAFGSCTWDSTHDVGPCVQSAINAAATNAGGNVHLPCGVFGFSTPIVNNKSGVKVIGCGIGMPRDPGLSVSANNATVLKWIGSSAALGVDIEPPDGNTSLTDAGWTGVWIDGQSLLTTPVRIASVSYSDFKLGVTNRGNVAFDLSVIVGQASLGSQHNTGSFYEYSASPPAGSVGILFRKDPGASGDWSLNNFTELYSNASLTPMLFANGDRNTVAQCTSFGTSPVVVANSADTLPSGLTNGSTMPTPMWRNSIIIANDCSIVVHGLQSGATFTPNAVAGTEGPATISLTSSATVYPTNSLLVSSTTGTAAGEVINFATGYASGVAPNAIVQSVGNGTTLNLAQNIVKNVSGGVSGTVTWGAVAAQAVSGSYTLTYNGTNYDLTAPAGGHSQTSIAPSGGTLTFTDLVIPWTTGAPVNGDNWTITLPASTTSNIQVYASDSGVGGNAVPDPVFEANAPKTAGCYGANNTSPCASIAPGQSIIRGAYAATSTSNGGATVDSSFNSAANGVRANIYGGSGNTNNSADSGMVGGHLNTMNASATYPACVGGQNNIQSGNDTMCLPGNSGSDNGRTGVAFQGSGACNGIGSCQGIHTVLSRTGAGGSPMRLFAHAQSAASLSNCVNATANNSAVGFTVTITLQQQGSANAETWNNWAMQLRRGASAAATVLDAATTPTPLNAALGGSVSAAADTTNACLNLQVTPPAGGTWTATAIVDGAESR